MANEKRLDLIDRQQLLYDLGYDPKMANWVKPNSTFDCVLKAPTVDAVEMPKGKPGDYLEWDNGTGFNQIYCIAAVMICEDCMRYELANFTPVVNHPNIVRIMSREETAYKMDGDGNDI